MNLDADACYRALIAKDRRFDGTFFVAVKTTGIYCRPVCPARTPGRDRCVFYKRAIEAERDGFRACFRCRPERAPGTASVDALPRAVSAAMARIDAGALNEGSVEDLAAELGMTSRHLRRAMVAELGVSPLDLATSRRIALARELLMGTQMPITEVAFASGFASLRRFNAAFSAHQGRAPSAMRRVSTERAKEHGASIRLTLDYRPPYDWAIIAAFLGARAAKGVERFDGETYVRALRLGDKAGFIAVGAAPARHALHVDVSPSLAGALMPVASLVRRLFDLDAQPALIGAHLRKDRRLAPLVRKRPGLRVPGAFDGFEILARAILGQQVSVAAATTLAARLVARCGEAVTTPFEGVERAWPDASRVASLSEAQIIALGLTVARAQTLRGAARAVADQSLVLDPTCDPAVAIDAMCELPGIGPWTAHYVAMRALRWPDAFLESDLGIKKALGGASPAACREAAERWRPWRAYAAMHLWNDL